MKRRPPLAVDTETTGLDIHHGCKPFYVSTCDTEGKLVSWKWGVDLLLREPIIPKDDIKEVQAYLRNRKLIFHNTKFDVRGLQSIGVFSREETNSLEFWDGIDDTVIAAHVLSSSMSKNLKDLALFHLDIMDDDEKELEIAVKAARTIGKRQGWRVAELGDPHFPAQTKSKAKWWKGDFWMPAAVHEHLSDELDVDQDWETVLDAYADRDAERTIGLWMLFKKGMKQERLKKLYNKRRKLLRVTYRMESHGVTVKRSALYDKVTEYKPILAKARETALKLADYKIDNLNSPKQLNGLLFGNFGLTPIGKEGPQGFTTKTQILEEIQEGLIEQSGKIKKKYRKAYDFIDNLIIVRKKGKAIEYLESYELFKLPCIKRGFILIRSNYNITGTATTRFSASWPNLQNVSKQGDTNLRTIFCPLPDREWFRMDYKNIEMRIFAYESGDKELISAFERGESVHLIFCKAIYPEEYAECVEDGVPFDKRYEATLYQWVKNGNFALIYGASKRKADQTYHKKGAYDLIKKRLPLVAKLMAKKNAEARKWGFIRTLCGYRLDKAVNYFVQGSAGWALVLAMGRIDDYLYSLDPDLYRMSITVHDELVFDFPRPFNREDEQTNLGIIKKVSKIMEASGEDLGLPLPVEVDRIRDNWSKKDSVTFEREKVRVAI